MGKFVDICVAAGPVVLFDLGWQTRYVVSYLFVVMGIFNVILAVYVSCC